MDTAPPPTAAAGAGRTGPGGAQPGSGPRVAAHDGAEDPAGGSPRPRARDLLALVRPAQWPKNLAVVPLALLDAPALDATALAHVAWALALFTLASALTYVVNDITDRQADRLHPRKRLRPIASGRVGVRTAVLCAVALAVLLAAALALRPLALGWPVLVYLAVNAGYSQGLKHVPLLDIFLVTCGFVLRYVQGAIALDQRPSDWLALCVLALCLLLVLGKRRHELTLGGTAHRPALRGYTPALIDQLTGLAVVVTTVAYLLYLRDDAAFTAGAPVTALLTAPFALFGLARYLQVVLVEGGGGNPVQTLFADRVTLINAALWSALLGTALIIHHASP